MKGRSRIGVGKLKDYMQENENQKKKIWKKDERQEQEIRFHSNGKMKE